jgi:thiamine pyrophosphate-dependent acetolactate synthase large subunit-like protein
MRRTDDKKDGGERLAGLSPAVSGPPGQTVIPFPRDRLAASVDLAAAGDPRQDPAAFIPIGSAVAAVVMRLGRARPRINVLVQTPEEEDLDQS